MVTAVFNPLAAPSAAIPVPSRKILIADDDPICRAIVLRLLKSWGYHCEVAVDGFDAMRMLERADAPAIALLDWLMPGISGPEICRNIRSKEMDRYTYLLLMSSRDSKQDLVEGLSAGADAYLKKPIEPEELRVQLDIASRVAYMEESLRDLHAETELFVRSVPSILIGTDVEGRVTRWNEMAEAVFDIAQESAKGHTLEACGVAWMSPGVEAAVTQSLAENAISRLDQMHFVKHGEKRCAALTVYPLFSRMGSIAGVVVIGADVTERRLLEGELRQAQKLEAIVQLAAGIAHEINTPIQFVGDNVSFLKNSWSELASFIACAQRLRGDAEALAEPAVQEFDRTVETLDLPYLAEEIPRALEQAFDGLQRVGRIVQAMKEFSHPGSEQLRLADLNRAISTTLVVARHEWKYVSEVETDFAQDMPLVPCILQELNQVILNLLVNAAQAIGEAAKAKGHILIRTGHDVEWAEISIADTGGGIPKEIRDRVFEPFFTTKQVGKGTGQGLALAHSVIVKRHGGKLWFESEAGWGTTFFIRLPLVARGRK